jgi:hypothetical protein
MPEVLDVALDSHETFGGQVLDPQGATVVGTPVTLFEEAGPVATTTTDARGRFAFHGLRGGLYGLEAAGTVRHYRLWAPRTAPPSARDGVLIVANGPAVRGRLNPVVNRQGAIYSWISEHYLITYTAIAAAIAVPIIVVNENRDKHPASP